ncbi:O-antigen ligase family protein [Streptomyces gobiensis]|uniref:O-antigen ligase family protein n=1 Tax=Streptomyces gobiensis TaxID=2875706 RepID=UPI001E5D0C50|nr:O-antigen ligase family protein [Streptomyces gobiensis]UGY94736.1 O-antigen ligase family protein [Streptomyces gobiensis]
MASPLHTSAGRESGALPDLSGAIVLGGCAAWALVTSFGREARPEGILLAVLAVAAGYAVGRISGSLLPAATATVAALAGLGLALTSVQALPGSAVTAPPGRSGETAALLALAAGAACCAAWATTARLRRLALWLLAAGIAVSALLLGSIAGCAAAVAVLLCSLAAGWARRRLPVLVALLLATMTVAGITWAVAERALPPGLTAVLEGQLTQHRAGLWRDAVTIAAEHPVTGAGPDRFGEASPTASGSADADGKPHSALLQLAAEQGVPGVLLLAGAYGWLLLACARSPRPTPVVLTAAAALTALAVLACAGNALSFNQVTMGAGLLAGIATAQRPEKS